MCIRDRVLEEPLLNVLGGNASARSEHRPDFDPPDVPAPAELERLEAALSRPPADGLGAETDVRVAEDLDGLRERDPIRGRTAHRSLIDPRRVGCLLYTSDAADDLTRVDLGGRRIIKKK